MFEIGIPIVYGSPKIAAYHRKALNIVNFILHNIRNPEDANPKRANIINCIDDNTRVELGKPTQMSGESSVQSLERAVADLKENKIDVLVTSPINKKNIQSDSFKYTGHTEYLSSAFEEKDYLMLMVSDILKVGVVTSHIPVSKIPESITSEKILNKLDNI